MNTIRKALRQTRSLMRQRGSALLVSLMVMVGLSLLGLAFVTISETEGAISVNQKNYTQTLQVAEAGAQMVVEWFQNPFWARDHGLAPQNVTAIKVNRVVELNSGRYKQTAGSVLFDKPFKPNFVDRFFGTEDNPDLLINDTTGATAALGSGNFLTRFNRQLFNNDVATATLDNPESIRVTEIRVYAPPIDGGLVNAEAGWTTAAGIPANVSGFWVGGSRFGIATVKVTASKFSPGGQRISQRSVKAVISEWPFPGPQGPVQSNANISTTGNLQVHWGLMTAESNASYTKVWTSLPHMDAFNKAAIEYGYDNTVFPVNAAAFPPALEREAWLLELIGRSFEDPWFEMRARGIITTPVGVPPGTPHPYKWTDASVDPTTVRTPTNGGWFHVQNVNQEPDQKEVLFPRMDYNFWKQVAVAADTQNNVYFLQPVVDGSGNHSTAVGGPGNPDYRDRAGNVRGFRQWVDVFPTHSPPAGTGPKSVPGYYFFDTLNGQNPQQGGGGSLGATIDMKGGTLSMKGFIYLNSTIFGTQGIGDGSEIEWNNWHHYNLPGEPYRDVGYREVNAAGTDWVSPFVMRGVANQTWDFQDLPNVPGGLNGIFDYVVANRTPTPTAKSRTPTSIPASLNRFIVPYTPGCNPGVDCSEPHEPYVNLVYPAPGLYLGSTLVRWHNPDDETLRRPKKATGVNTTVSCGDELFITSSPAAAIIADRERCTSNAYDRDGPVMRIDDMLMDGVFYNEGAFDSQGNARYFGSVLIQGNVVGAGNPDIFFDEKLVKGQWPPGNFGFPRVFVSSLETDQ